MAKKEGVGAGVQVRRRPKVDLGDFPIGKVGVIGSDDSLEVGYAYSLKELIFFEEFLKDLDFERSCREAGIQDSRRLKSRPEIMRVCREMFEAHFRKLYMKAELAGSEHIKRLEVFWQDYLRSDDGKFKAAIASSIAKMSGDHLRAAGAFDGGGERNKSNVVINIDLGGEKGVVIDGEKVG